MKTLLFLAMLATTAVADGPVRHVVQFKFRKDATAEQIERVITEFAELRRKITVIESFEWGTNASPEGLAKGLTHCWILSFDSEKARDFYLHHPEHQAFAALVKPLLDDVQVIDFIPHKEITPLRTRRAPRGIDAAWGAQKTG